MTTATYGTTAIRPMEVRFQITQSATTKESKKVTTPAQQRKEQLQKQADTLNRNLRFLERMELSEPSFNVDQQPYLIMCEWYSKTGQRTTAHVQGFKNRSEQTIVWTAYENRGGVYDSYSTWMDLVENFFFRQDRRNQGLIIYAIDKLSEVHRFQAMDGTEALFPEDIPKDAKVAARAAKAKSVYGPASALAVK